MFAYLVLTFAQFLADVSRSTPYSCAPYGEDQYPAGQSRSEMKNYFNEGWIFVRCDVRGRYA